MRVILCGDICPTPATVPAFEAGDVSALLGGAEKIISEADFAVANLECALTDRETRIRKCGPNLKGRPAYAKVLTKAGLTHFGLSNNHVNDFGVKALYDTCRAVEDAGGVWFGAGENDQDSRKPLFVTKGGKTLAIVAVCEHEYSYALPDKAGSNPFDPFDTMEDITLAKQQADWVVVMYHGGKEQSPFPSPRLQKACRAMVRAGADLVLCQHSHCIGCKEDYRGGTILYGQGNFLFVSHPEHPHWHSGLMLDVTFGDKIDINYIPMVAGEGGVAPASFSEKEKILLAFVERSHKLTDPKAAYQEWLDFCHSMPYYIDAVKNAYIDVPEGETCRQVFPHYLDCEAHLDVWKTIYPTWHAAKTDEIGGE